MTNWEKEIGTAYRVKEHMMKIDITGLWPYHLPEVGATPGEILAVEALLQEPLPQPYKEFLMAANGWLAFYQAVDLFGTKDLFKSPRFQRAEHLLATVADFEAICGLKPEEVFPIAVSQDAIDVFLIARISSKNPGAVFWIAGQLIDEFPDFAEFFLSMVDYNREEIADFEADGFRV